MLSPSLPPPWSMAAYFDDAAKLYADPRVRPFYPAAVFDKVIALETVPQRLLSTLPPILVSAHGVLPVGTNRSVSAS